MDQFLIAETDFPHLQKVHRRGPHSPLFNGYHRQLPRGQGDWGVKLTTHLHILPRLEVGAATIPPPPPHMPSRCTGTNLPSLHVTINITSVGLFKFCEQLITQVHITPTLHFTDRNSAVRIVVTFVTVCLKTVHHLVLFKGHLLAKFHAPSFGVEQATISTSNLKSEKISAQPP